MDTEEMDDFSALSSGVAAIIGFMVYHGIRFESYKIWWSSYVNIYLLPV